MDGKPESAEQAIRRLIKKQVQAYNRGDAAAFLENIAPDRIAMNPEQPLTVGRGDVDELQAFFDEVDQRTELVIDELVVTGKWAFERGRGVGTASPKSVGAALDPAATYSYKYMRIWRCREGRWMVVRSIWNSSQPDHAIEPAPQPVKIK
ncbi:MAG TPA: nuclear transport factor 2 family protein [Acidobacteriota bacterium]|nr:nuclear transport factor 2 family protein [Acidobacteriota bacterium]